MIDSYTFGEMVIDGHRYGKDLIVLPDGNVIHPWWRHAGHELVVDDLKELLETSPKILVVGTGNPGMMKPHPTLCSDLQSQGVKMIVLPTEQAISEYNALLQSGEMIGACFHLTC